MRTFAVLILVFIFSLVCILPSFALEEKTINIDLDLNLVELFPGLIVEWGVIKGAIFVGEATHDDHVAYIFTIINYDKNISGEDGIFTVTSGHWFIIDTYTDTLSGEITGGTANWRDWERHNTRVGADLIQTQIVTGGTGGYCGSYGDGIFEGYLDHQVFPPILKGKMALEIAIHR